MLKIDLAAGESITIGNNIVVTMEEKSGQRARLSFMADKSIPIKKKKKRKSKVLDFAKEGLVA